MPDIKTCAVNYKRRKGHLLCTKKNQGYGSTRKPWMSDVNHCVTKALVEQYPAKTLFVLEDLTGIRGATEQVRRKDRYVQVSWSYYDFEQKLNYKAARKSSKMINVGSEYTSQRCPVCGRVQKTNGDNKLHRFCCKKCVYRSNDDRIGAMNLCLLGHDWLKTPEIEPKEIKIIRSKSPVYGAESRVPDATPRQALTSKPKKGRSSQKTVTDTSGQLQVLRQYLTTLRTP